MRDIRGSGKGRGKERKGKDDESISNIYIIYIYLIIPERFRSFVCMIVVFKGNGYIV